jgi:hypothetical protein
LKLASTIFAYDYLKLDQKATESKVARLKDFFITNLFLEKIGRTLGLNKYMRTKDPEPKDWCTPYTEQK